MRFVLGSRRDLGDRFARRVERPVDEPPEPMAPRVPTRLPPIVTRPDAASAGPLPDLLNLVPTSTVDAAPLLRALAFSFLAEDDGGAWAHALDGAPLAASDFDPECFFLDLFVDDFVRSCMNVHIAGRPVALQHAYLVRILSQPPADPRVAAQRSAVLGELAEAAPLRAALEDVYTALCELRKLFEGQSRVGIRGEQARRRLELLQQLHRTFEKMGAAAFVHSQSALQRIAQFAAHVQASAGHARLSELLQYENARAYADLTLQLGADGAVRGLKLVGLRESTLSRYHVPALRQWTSRLWLWLKGYRVTDGEILDRWLDQVFEGVSTFLPALVQLQGDIELFLAGLAFRDAALRHGLPVCFPEAAQADEPCKVEELFNPLLMGLGIRPVSCSLTLGAPGQITLVTGPNSGGKTRLLQALGLLHLCAQAGLFVPAKSARLRHVPGIFASLSQLSSAEQPEGRLGTELLRIRMLFERATRGCLVLVDELCSGTSPSEGEEMFSMVLELLHELGPSAFISTHFLKFAAALAREPEPLDLRFLQVELDGQQHATYQFVAGVAETSLARQTASRLGVTREELRALLAAKR